VQVMELARSLCAQGRTVAAVCHDVRMLSAYADRLLEMDAGSIVEDGDGAAECKEEPLCV